MNQELKDKIKETKELLNQLRNESVEASKQANYLWKYGGYPCYTNTKTTFIKSGEDYHQHLLEELQKAKEFIFLEYFILEEGKMLNSVLEILAEKVKL